MAEGESESTAFSLGKGARIGKIEVGGHVAGRDVVAGTAPADQVSAQDLLQVLEVLKRLEEQIASLAEAPAGLRDDAKDELRKAHEAGAQGEHPRAVHQFSVKLRNISHQKQARIQISFKQAK